jgi:hypothetical protein
MEDPYIFMYALSLNIADMLTFLAFRLCIFSRQEKERRRRKSVIFFATGEKKAKLEDRFMEAKRRDIRRYEKLEITTVETAGQSADC